MFISIFFSSLFSNSQALLKNLKQNSKRLISLLLIYSQFTQIAFAAVALNHAAPNTLASVSASNTINTPFSPRNLNSLSLTNQSFGYRGPLDWGVNYSDLTGTYFNAQYVLPFGQRFALGALGEYGADQYRINGTLGYELSTNSQIKASIERLGQRLPFQFDTGSIDSRVHQDAYGARFQRLYDGRIFRGLNAGGYWAKAANKELNPVVFTSNGFNCNSLRLAYSVPIIALSLERQVGALMQEWTFYLPLSL